MNVRNKPTAIEQQIARHKVQYEGMETWELDEQYDRINYSENTAKQPKRPFLTGLALTGAILSTVYLVSLLIGLIQGGEDPTQLAYANILFILRAVLTVAVMILAQVYFILELFWGYLQELYQLVWHLPIVQSMPANIKHNEFYFQVSFYTVCIIGITLIYWLVNRSVYGASKAIWLAVKVILIAGFVTVHFDAITQKNRELVAYLEADQTKATLFSKVSKEA